VASERLYFGREHLDDLNQGLDLEFERLNIRLDGRVRLVVRELDRGDFFAGVSQSILDPLSKASSGRCAAITRGT
jgi:hypothetical protein